MEQRTLLYKPMPLLCPAATQAFKSNISQNGILPHDVLSKFQFSTANWISLQEKMVCLLSSITLVRVDLEFQDTLYNENPNVQAV